MTTNSAPWVMGISASHNGAVCLLKGDKIVVAIQEERLTRRKRERLYGAQQSKALQYCFDFAKIEPRDLSMVVIAVQGEAESPMHNLKSNPLLRLEANNIPTLTISHHYAHAVSAMATSGFDESAVLVVDGMGSPIQDLSDDERSVVKNPHADIWEIISLYSASGTTIKALEKHMTTGVDFGGVSRSGMYPFRSLGIIFSSAARQIFGNSMDAGKVMGLAPYGRPTIPVHEFFEIRDGEFVFHDTVPAMFPHDERWPQHKEEYQNLAASVQVALEEALLYLVDHLYELCPSENLCYAGGVALNSVANERIIRESPFRNVYIVPAAEDSGPAIGAAYHGLWELTRTNTRQRLQHDAVGREYSPAVINRALSETPGVEVLDTEDYLDETVELLCAGKNIGWFQGRSELGPRALGQRSIICDPRRADAKEELNSRVKHREAFRPFAPVILLEEADKWFEWDGSCCDSPYMLRVAKFREERRAQVPAVVHVDGTGRVQTVTEEANGEFYRLVKRFYERTGVPIILNTSFNVMGMPIVERPEDALYCLQITGLDYCVLDRTIVGKRKDILLGLDAIPQKQISAEVSRANGNGRKDSDSIFLPAKFSFSLEDYVGRYEHANGVMDLELDGPNLKAHFNGMSTILEPRQKNTFEVTGSLFNKSMVVFMSGEKGEIARLSVFPGPGLGLLGDFTFTREAEVEEAEERLLNRFPGRYAVEDKVLEVILRDENELVITAFGQPEYVLVPGKGNHFTLKNTPGYSIEFKVSEDDVVSEAIVEQPNGIFILKKV